jgi:hypothetical protein
MDYISFVNLIFSLTIVALSFNKYRDTGAKAFVFIALGFLMYGISHFSLLMEWAGLKEVLIAIRSVGYILVIIGLLV